MDSSPASVADMLLQRHRSSLQPAAAAAAAAATTSLQQQDQPRPNDEAPATTVGVGIGGGGVGGGRVGGAAAASDAELERIMQAARWGNGGGKPPQAQVSMAADERGGAAGLPRMREEPLSPVTVPAKEARQPDIVRHEAADVYDVLEFRLRNNDRDLHSLLSRSADRLAQSEHEDPRSSVEDLTLPSEAPAAPPAAPTPPAPTTLVDQDRSTAAALAAAADATDAAPSGALGSMASPTPPPPRGVPQDAGLDPRFTPPQPGPASGAAIVDAAGDAHAVRSVSPPRNSASGMDKKSRAGCGDGGGGGAGGEGGGAVVNVGTAAGSSAAAAAAAAAASAGVAAAQAGAGAGPMPAPVAREEA
ncbi:unnamed protein product, partial [Scytosiphon promiscuus]